MDDFDDGWDSRAVLVEGRWVDRSPRRAEVAPALRREADLLAWLAPRLPLPVPVPRLVSDEPLRLRHRLIEGEPCEGTSAAQGAVLGAFLRALHRAGVAVAVGLGVPDARRSQQEHLAHVDRFRVDVLPLLPGDVQREASSLLDRACSRAAAPCLVHGDLGPVHVLVNGGRLSGVIDWTDAHVGDPAIDLAWALFGTTRAFAEAVARAYGLTGELRTRAHDWHALGPWHEVVYGQDTGQPGFVDSGVAGVVRRLRTA